MQAIEQAERAKNELGDVSSRGRQQIAQAEGDAQSGATRTPGEADAPTFLDRPENQRAYNDNGTANGPVSGPDRAPASGCS